MKKERQKRKKKEERITYKERMWCLRERERKEKGEWTVYEKVKGKRGERGKDK